MGKTFLVGFIGLVLVGSLMTGLYLINQPTNPASKASSGEEIVNPIKPPTDDGQTENKLNPLEDASSSASLSGCQSAFGAKSTDSNFILACDLDNNGIINVLDLSKMR